MSEIDMQPPDPVCKFCEDWCSGTCEGAREAAQRAKELRCWNCEKVVPNHHTWCPDWVREFMRSDYVKAK